jgi:hypothetical protein
MAPYVGQQYSADQIWDFYCYHADVHKEEEGELRPTASRIRAFDVPALKDAIFTADRLAAVPPKLQALFMERLPGTTWDLSHVNAKRIAGLKKYSVFHITTPAPVDETTQQLMALEVFGYLTQLNGEKKVRGWLMDWYRALSAEDQARMDDIVIGDMSFRIERASYANTATPGIGVPFFF